MPEITLYMHPAFISVVAGILGFVAIKSLIEMIP
jgi:hypothetical protein